MIPRNHKPIHENSRICMKINNLIVNPAIYCYANYGASLRVGAILPKFVPATRARSPLHVLPAEVESHEVPSPPSRKMKEENINVRRQRPKM